VKANAIFVYGNQTPAAEFLSDLLARDATGHIVVDGNGTASKPLAFAAGDVISGAPHTIEAARASGELAARSIIARLKT
jgi:thioredoxin reductase (NADPH)